VSWALKLNWAVVMGWTKQQFVSKALSSIGMANYSFDIQPEQTQDILSSLDSMMAAWDSIGIRLGYPMPSGMTTSDLSSETGVPDTANLAVYSNLALTVAPMFGKTISPELKIMADKAYKMLLSLFAYPTDIRQQLPSTMPLGAGNKTWSIDHPFVIAPVVPLLAGQDAVVEFN
jgi:hypothetical protein